MSLRPIDTDEVVSVLLPDGEWHPCTPGSFEGIDCRLLGPGAFTFVVANERICAPLAHLWGVKLPK